MKEYPFRATAFTGEPSFHTMPTGDGDRYIRFVLDLSTVQFPRNPCVVDYDHNTGEPIGQAYLTVEQNAIRAEGVFVSASELDRAFYIGETAGRVPYGVSPTITLDGATVALYEEGEIAHVNGQEYAAPIAVYSGAKIIGISVCPLPTDDNTDVTLLKRDGFIIITPIKGKVVKMTDELENKNPIPVDEETAEQLGDETGVQDGVQSVRDPELQAFIDEFGLEKGVNFFQRGLTLDDAKMEDYAALKKLAKLNANEEKSREGETETQEGTPPDDEKTVAQLSLDLRKTVSAVNGLVQAMNRMNVVKLGTQQPPRQRYNQGKRTYFDAVYEAARR